MLSEDQINEYAREAGTTPDATELSGNAVYRFARAIEREARRQALEEAAKVCDSVDNYANPMTARDCADAIRALKETP